MCFLVASWDGNGKGNLEDTMGRPNKAQAVKLECKYVHLSNNCDGYCLLLKCKSM